MKLNELQKLSADEISDDRFRRKHCWPFVGMKFVRKFVMSKIFPLNHSQRLIEVRTQENISNGKSEAYVDIVIRQGWGGGKLEKVRHLRGKAFKHETNTKP